MRNEPFAHIFQRSRNWAVSEEYGLHVGVLVIYASCVWGVELNGQLLSTVVGMHQAWTYRSHDFLAVDNLLGREPRARAVKRSEQSSI